LSPEESYETHGACWRGIGPIHATADREKTLPLSPVLGVAALAGGVALLIEGVRKQT
jgi:hypothetical protein